LAHGLGVKPKLIAAALICQTAELGYSINDEVEISTGQQDSLANTRGLSVVPDATNLNIRYGSQTTTFSLVRKDTGVAAAATNANWKLVMRAWA
jgi:archaellum component FlaG (FlaF/FlaG flagellin family)